MMDYSELVKQLRDSEDWAAKDGGIPVGLIYRLSQAADAIEELQAAVEREKTYTQFWEDAAKTCKAQYEKMEKKMLDWQAVADEHWEAYQHWFHNYQNDVPKWIPVTERLPEHLTSVIVHRKDGGIFMWEYFDTSPTDECWLDDSMNVYSFYDVTHWQPLPEPPKDSVGQWTEWEPKEETE